MEAVLTFAAAHASRSGLVSVSDAQAWFHDSNKARKALLQLERLGLAFPVAHASYAVPSQGEFVRALALRDPWDRLASWLFVWLRSPERQPSLASGLAWDRASFLGLAVREYTNLRWDGPLLLVPIDRGSQRMGKLHQRVSLFAADQAWPSERRPRLDAPLPSRAEVARILAVHQDPRLREASEEALAGARPKDLRDHVSRTDPPLPFPNAGVKLPLGPPFRYRLYAPLSWVTRNVRHAHPGA
ncbi:MAG: hypothetical protein LC624_11085 [Halobacteriales archaeon]|nr:hypothetical protein [Halobacteriales archaeon]